MREKTSSCPRLRRARWALALLCVASAASAQIRPAPAFTPAQLQALPTDGWLTNGGNLFNQRYSPLDKIDRGNVAQLKAKWRTHLGGSGATTQYSGQGQPIVHDGVIYITTGASDVFAVSVDSGEILWRYTAAIDPTRVRACCGWTNRGVALGDGKIFLGQLDAQLVALDQRSGKVLWSCRRKTRPGFYHHQRAALLRRTGDHGLRRRRSRHSRSHQCL